MLLTSLLIITNYVTAENYPDKWWPNDQSHNDKTLLNKRITGIENNEKLAIGAINHYEHSKSFRKKTWSGNTVNDRIYISIVPYMVKNNNTFYFAPYISNNDFETLKYRPVSQYNSDIRDNPSYYSTIGLIFNNQQDRDRFYTKLNTDYRNQKLQWISKPVEITASNNLTLKSVLKHIFKAKDTYFLDKYFSKYKFSIRVYGLKYSFDFERYPMIINEMEGLNYSLDDELLFFDSKDKCLKGEPVTARFLFTKSHIKQKLLKKQNCWIKVLGVNQKSLCAQGEPIQHTLVFNLMSKKQSQKRIIFIIADSLILAKLIIRKQIWNTLYSIIQSCKNKNLPVDFMALKENQDCILITQTDDPESQPITITQLKSSLPLDQSIAKPYVYMREAIKSKHKGNKIKKIIYIVDSQNLISNPKTEYNLPPATWVGENKLLHVITDDKCDVWNTQIQAECTMIDRGSFHDKVLNVSTKFLK